MSSDKADSSQAADKRRRKERKQQKRARRAQKAQASDKRSSRGSQQTRTKSIARSISHDFWWRKLGFIALLDLLIIIGLGFAFVFQSQYLAQSGVDSSSVAFTGFLISTENGGLDILCQVVQASGTQHAYSLIAFLKPFRFMGALVLICEFVLLFSVFPDTRRVRRKLAPLNELAVAAEAVGSNAAKPTSLNPPSGMSKIESLEQAIARASVDSPRVATGDKDLQSIEVALNSLLRQMQEAKLQQMRFVSDASHELRTPIAVIQGYVNLLDRWGKTDPDVLEESIASLKNESAHMQELVEQLLFLARGDSGRNTLQLSSFNMAALVREVCDESRMISDGHAFECSASDVDCVNPRFQMTGDEAMVKQAMRIIVQNAEKYSPANSTIRLDALAQTGERADGKALVGFSVQDEGMGIAPEDAAHVFERFYRADDARSPETNGTGLGLSIAQWIVEAHDGHIDLLSMKGVGTRFTVTFPVERD